ncbi:MAG: hypothetical protein K9N09_08460 [Candidatus Cloacimonetes bacterium]|nr:hypothetical protein [Candidatus Cloacimonadota bacterium]MCF7814135.1 hypothetical protein [Candidatus Cloacimonadota bacterium]MCF7868716.1 hypothetical protein [Candidatus Cloacimonadota bacterium]MCF7884134.1 hypothetical protein [Candidatus Cloacimonadota bacterium]
MTKVLFIWRVNDRLKQYLQDGLSKIADLKLIFPTEFTNENYQELAKDVDIIVGWRPAKELLESAKNLKLYINPGAGIQHLIKLFREVTRDKEIILVNGHGNSYFTAQHGVALLLAAMNKIIPHHNWMKEGKWRLGDNEARSIPLRDRKVGFLGYGNVNRKIHMMLQGFDLEFAALKRDWQFDTMDLKQFKIEELHDFLVYIDILFCAVPHTSKTTNLITEKELELLGKDAILVNLSRGAVVNEKALFEALKNRKIDRAAIDVWYDYQPEPDEKGRRYPYSYPFYELENIVLSPHRAASPFDDLKRWDEVVENISRLCAGRSDFLNIVNLENEY